MLDVTSIVKLIYKWYLTSHICMISGVTIWLFDNSRMPNSMYKNTYDTFPHLSIKNLLITTRHQYDVFISFFTRREYYSIMQL